MSAPVSLKDVRHRNGDLSPGFVDVGYELLSTPEPQRRKPRKSRIQRFNASIKWVVVAFFILWWFEVYDGVVEVLGWEKSYLRPLFYMSLVSLSTTFGIFCYLQFYRPFFLGSPLPNYGAMEHDPILRRFIPFAAFAMLFGFIGLCVCVWPIWNWWTPVVMCGLSIDLSDLHFVIVRYIYDVKLFLSISETMARFIKRYLSNDSDVSDCEGQDDFESREVPILKHRYSLDVPGFTLDAILSLLLLTLEAAKLKIDLCHFTTAQTQQQDNNTVSPQMGPKLVVVMVGLPARGKSYIVKKLKRYLTWLQYETKIFNVGNIRRNTAHSIQQRIGGSLNHGASFFDPHNNDALRVRDEMAMECLDELISWLKKGGRVGIHDATNSTTKRRKMILNRVLREHSFKVLFIESICTDPTTIEANMRLKLSGPDYRLMNPDDALADFKKRVKNYEDCYETISEEEEKNDMQYCKLINVGKKVIANNIQGFLSGQCIFYLMNFNLVSRQIWMTRHGESTDNVIGRIGGDAPLSDRGRKYAACLARFMHTQKLFWREKEVNRHPTEAEDHHISNPNSSFSASTPNPTRLEKNFLVWTSSLKRTIQTAEKFPPTEFDVMHIRFLNEIYAGIYEEMTYQEISKMFPEEYQARQNNKLYYRYPGMGGESYLDVIHRINPLLVEIERMTDNILIVTHQVVLRILLAYFLDVEKEKVPNIEVPLHSLYCLQPKPYGTELIKWKYDEEQDWFFQYE
ncbi:hypothetical protein G9A89_009644 [Geosiphon pyriformis]|nr:hypothetical protein G9A89_009644 [Geosiphon pyriformis]